MPQRIVHAALRSFRTPAARYPADPRAVWVMALFVLSGILLVFVGATPGSINAQLDPVWVVIWGLMLVLGALTTLVGIAKLDTDGILLEQVGSVSMGGACVVYAGAIFGTVGWAGSVPALVVGGFGLASFWRWGQLQALISQGKRAAEEAE
jgi:hypothetical protein